MSTQWTTLQVIYQRWRKPSWAGIKLSPRHRAWKTSKCRTSCVSLSFWVNMCILMYKGSRFIVLIILHCLNFISMHIFSINTKKFYLNSEVLSPCLFSLYSGVYFLKSNLRCVIRKKDYFEEYGPASYLRLQTNHSKQHENLRTLLLILFLPSWCTNLRFCTFRLCWKQPVPKPKL